MDIDEYKTWLYSLTEEKLLEEYSKKLDIEKTCMNDYINNKGSSEASFYAKKWRLSIYPIILIKEILDKKYPLKNTTENIYFFAKEFGVKACARNFNMEPSNVRYHIKKYEKLDKN